MTPGRQMAHRVVVVGGGAAGGTAAQTVAARAAAAGARVEVVVVGQEDRRPYNRTTVNKGLLSGAVDDDGIVMGGVDHVGVAWQLSRRAASLDAAARTVQLDDGTSLTADAVVIATGAVPRPLPAHVDPLARNRVVPLRTAADTALLRGLAVTGPVAVAGAGLLGSELPGALRGLAPSVSLVDPALHPLNRQVGPLVGGWIADAQRQQGVDLRMGRSITAVRASGARGGDERTVVELDDGSELEAAAVVACLGVIPDTGWLAGSGVELHAPSGGGVEVDLCQRVRGAEGLYAAGDVAAIPGPDATVTRIEHWGAAIDQGRRAADTLLSDLGLAPSSGTTSESILPSYSTYVGDTKLTLLGWNAPGCTEHVALGAPGDARFLVVHVLEGVVVGAVGVGGARAANRIRPLLEARAELSEVRAALDALASSAS